MRHPTGLLALAPGAYAFIPPPPERLAANSAIFIGEKCAAIVDAQMCPANGRALWAAFRKISDKPAQYLILTHWHGDHHYGHGELEYGQLLAHPGTFELLKTHGPGFQEDFKKKFKPGEMDAIPALRNSEPLLKDRTLDLGGMEIEIRLMGHAHTPGDLVVFHRASGTVAAGDLFYASRPPVTAGSDKTNWIRRMEEIMSWNPKALIPGHGPVQDGNGAGHILRSYQHDFPAFPSNKPH